MPITKSNVITKEYKDKFGDQAVFRSRCGLNVLAIPPRKPRKEMTQNMIDTCY